MTTNNITPLELRVKRNIAIVRAEILNWNNGTFTPVQPNTIGDSQWIYCKHCNERTISIKGICLECQKKGRK